MMKPFLSVLFISVFLSASALPADPPQTTSALPEVLVTAEPSRPIGMADEAARQLVPTTDTAQLLLKTPGVYLVGAGGASSLPVIHGLGDDRLRIQVDGMDLVASCPNHMNPPLSYLAPSQVGSLKVYTGLVPVSIGGDSLGGAIVAETATPRFASPERPLLAGGHIGSFYRSNNDAAGGFLRATVANENLSLGYTGDYGKADNYKAAKAFKAFTATDRPGHALGREEVGSTAYEMQTHGLDLAVKRGDQRLEAKLGYQNVPYQLYPNQRMDSLENEQKRIALRYLGQLSWVKLEARAYHERVDHYMDFGDDKRFWYGANAPDGAPHGPIGPDLAAGMPMYTESKNSGFSLRTEIEWENQLFRLGSEFQHYRLDDWWPPSGAKMWPDTFWNIRNGQRDRTAVFGEWEGSFAPGWLGLAGVRYERVRMEADHVHGYSTAPMAMGNQAAEADAFNRQDRLRNDDNIDVTALARHTFNGQLALEFGYAFKTRSPNLYQRYTWSSWSMPAVMNNLAGDGNGYVGDIRLDPEHAQTLSATLDWHSIDRQWQLKTTPFYTYVDDYIDAVRLTDFPKAFNVLKYTNARAALHGVDFWGSMPLGKNAVGDFSLEGTLAYTRGENLDSHQGLYNIMPLNTKVALVHKRTGWENALELLWVDSKDHLSEVRNEMATASYSLLDLRLSYSWAKARVDVGVENLLDKFYSTPLGGAYVGQGTTMNMTSGAPWGIAVPGMGRSIYLAWRMEF